MYSFELHGSVFVTLFHSSVRLCFASAFSVLFSSFLHGACRKMNCPEFFVSRLVDDFKLHTRAHTQRERETGARVNTHTKAAHMCEQLNNHMHACVCMRGHRKININLSRPHV